MSALDHLQSASEIVSEARRLFEQEKSAIETKASETIEALEDRLLAAEMKAAMHEKLHAEERAARASAERVTAGLLVRFGLVAKIFDDAKAYAENLLSTGELQWPPSPPSSGSSSSSDQPSPLASSAAQTGSEPEGNNEEGAQ